MLRRRHGKPDRRPQTTAILDARPLFRRSDGLQPVAPCLVQGLGEDPLLFAEAARLRENSGPINGLSIGLGGELLPMPFRVLNCRRRVGRASVGP